MREIISTEYSKKPVHRPALALSAGVRQAGTMQSEAPLTLILSPLGAGRGELELTCFESLFSDPDAMPPKVPLSLCKRERVRVRVRLDGRDTAKRMSTGRWTEPH